MKKINNILPVIGMSPGNGYFSQEIILKLIEKVLNNYGGAIIFVPDIPAISTYEAMGYSPKIAKTKAISKGNNLKNKVKNALAQLIPNNQNIFIVDWLGDVDSKDVYANMYSRVVNLFDTNGMFRSHILTTTSEVLKNSGKDIPDMDSACLKASHYILAEFAFLEVCPELFSTNEIRYIYHKDWPVYEHYISGRFDGIIRKHLSFEKLVFI